MSLGPRLLGRYDEYSSFDRTLQLYRNALAKLLSFGIRIADNSRLRTYERRLAGLSPDPRAPVPLSLADRLLFDLREIDEVVLIAESFDAPPTDAERERLRFLVSGTDDPDVGTSGRSRDAQFELFLRAAFRRAGSEVVLGSPDLLMPHEHGDIPIEAKRPGSAGRLDDRIRDAVAQLDRQASMGIAAISLDHVIRPAGTSLSVTTASEVGPAAALLVSRYLAQQMRSIANRCRGSKAAAILFVFRTPARAEDTNLSLIGANIHLEVAVDPDGPHRWMLEAISDVIGRIEV